MGRGVAFGYLAALIVYWLPAIGGFALAVHRRAHTVAPLPALAGLTAAGAIALLPITSAFAKAGFEPRRIRRRYQQRVALYAWALCGRFVPVAFRTLFA